MIKIESDIKIGFETLNYKFQSLIQDKQEELNKIIKNIIDNFNFEEALSIHINSKLKDSIEQAFDEIDITQSLKNLIWSRLEKEIKDLEKDEGEKE